MEFTDFLSTIAAALGTLGVSGYLLKFLAENRQFRIDNFHRYASKYQDYISSIVEHGTVQREFDPTSSFDRSISVKIFMLFSEEFYLGEERKLISKKVWEIWKTSISHHMNDKYFQGAWYFARSQMDLEGHFAQFIDAAIPKQLGNQSSSSNAA